VVAGLSNAYAGYVATREEYAAQHYEGASTHFGPWTLAAYQQEFAALAAALREGRPVDPGPVPRDLACCQTTLQTGVVFDDTPLGKDFGSVHRDARPAYRRGETVRVTFWGGHPKNDLEIEGSYLQVQRAAGGSWVTIARDWDWETKYLWRRDKCFPTLACSQVTIEWTIPEGIRPGTFRIRHDGSWKSGWDGRIRPYAGFSREFTVN
jgi:neutral ceramidase